MLMTENECVTQIPFKKTGFFSTMMCDYLEQSPQIQPFYNHFPDIVGFRQQLLEKHKTFTKHKREVLVSVLQSQYKGLVNTSEITNNNIEALLNENTFTITTGHQLNLFSGPLYFLYKIISAINLAEELAAQFPNNTFVPVYWMATEDHDFEEINYFNFKGKKVQWKSNQTGAVGRFTTEGLDKVFEEVSKHFGTSKNAEFLKELFHKAYISHSNLAEATRFLANELFAEYGLVIIDGDSPILKQEFAPFVKTELKEKIAFKQVTQTSSELAKTYKIQVNPREINLFYLTDTIRERIIKENNRYKINNTDISFTEDEVLVELEAHPERFSPNVIMRPLYQEVILPNLCYIGGGGEMAYWMQLKDYFNAVEVPFPILLLRNSVQVLTGKQLEKLKKLNVSKAELFLKQKPLIDKKIAEVSELTIDLSVQKEILKEQFKALEQIAKKTDFSFLGAVKAQEKKQLKGLNNLEKRLLKAEKRKHADLVKRLSELQNSILPNQSLEERQRNFSEYYLEYGDSFIVTLKKILQPLDLEFTLLTL